MYTNAAALLTDAFGDLEVRPVPFPAARPGQLILRNRAIAVNPLDLIKQTTGNVMYRWLPYPAVLGEDVAGEVVEVGAGVTRFVAGDRVMAYALGMEKGRDHLAEGGFQLYTAVDAALAAPLPDSLAFEDAVVLPLAVSTAATALFQDDHLVGEFHRDEALRVVDDGGVRVGLRDREGAAVLQAGGDGHAMPGRRDRGSRVVGVGT